MEDLGTFDYDNLNKLNNEQREACLEKHNVTTGQVCPADFDGALCWPPTAWNTISELNCFEQLQGVQYDSTKLVSRECLDGEWTNFTNYSICEVQAGVGNPVDTHVLIYVSGYVISIAALSLAVFIFLYFKDLRCLRNTIHTNLMLAYILSACNWVLFYSYTDYWGHHQTLCMIVVSFLYYFYLTNFFWMLVEGLYLYMLVVETFAAENIKLNVYATIGWGAPAVFIIIWVLCRGFIRLDHYTGFEELSIETETCMWFSEHPIDWIHNGPIIVALIVNLFFLIRIMWVLITKLRSANTLETEQYRKATKALLVLIPLLGITNLLVMLAPSDDPAVTIVYNYVRAVMLSTQGFTVSVLYCFMNTEVRHAIRYRLERWKTGRTIGGGRRRGASYSKDWSPRSRTESIRLYSHPSKRESAASETTTTTLLVPRTSLAPHYDGRHLHADYITTGTGSASGEQSPV